MGNDISKWPWKTWLLSTGATAVTGVVVACTTESYACAAYIDADASADARADADAQGPLPDAGNAGDAGSDALADVVADSPTDAARDAPDAD